MQSDGDGEEFLKKRPRRTPFPVAGGDASRKVYLEGEEWNDGLVAMIREKVHMEADRKAMAAESSMIPNHHFEEKITYRVGNKVICCLEGARIGILYETTFAAKSFLEKLTVHEHTIPFFLPIQATENEFLSMNTIKFIDRLGDMLQAFVDRREQVRLIKEFYGNQIGELYHSLPYHLIEFVLDDVDCKITVRLRYTDLVSVLPSKVRVFAWPINHSNGVELSKTNPNPARLSYAEDALRTMSLPEAYAELVLNLPQATQQVFPVGSPS